jgi:hypothetical protein
MSKISRLAHFVFGLFLMYYCAIGKGTFDQSGVVNNPVFRHGNYYYSLGYDCAEYALIVPLLFGAAFCIKALRGT